jgi:hypothetical protein
MITLINKILESVDDYVDSKNIQNKYTSYKSFREMESGFSNYYHKGHHSHYIEIKHNDIHFLDDILFKTEEQKNTFESFKIFCCQLLYGHTYKSTRNQITIKYKKDTKIINDIEFRWNSSVKLNISADDLMTLSVINNENNWTTKPSNYSQLNVNLDNVLNELKEIIMLKAGFSFDQLDSCEFISFMSKSIKEIRNEQFINKKYNYKDSEELKNAIQKNLKNTVINAGMVSIDQDHNETVLTIFNEIMKDKNEWAIMKQLMNLIMFYFKMKSENPMIFFECRYCYDYIDKTNNLSNIFYVYTFDNLIDLSIGKNDHTYSYTSQLNTKTSESLHDVYNYLLGTIRDEINQTIGNGDNNITLSHIKVYEMLHI